MLLKRKAHLMSFVLLLLISTIILVFCYSFYTSNTQTAEFHMIKHQHYNTINDIQHNLILTLQHINTTYTYPLYTTALGQNIQLYDQTIQLTTTTSKQSIQTTGTTLNAPLCQITNINQSAQLQFNFNGSCITITTTT